MDLVNKLFDLTGKTAVVTGASSGLGAYFAEILANQGATVVITARRLDRLEALSAQINNAGGKGHRHCLRCGSARGGCGHDGASLG